MDKSKLDANTRKQLHELEQDADIKMLVEAHNEVIARLGTLEKARNAQIALNSEFLDFIQQKSEIPEEELRNILRVPNEEKVTLWQHIKNKLSN